MYGTQFGFLVDRPVSSGLEQHEAFRAAISGAGVENSRYYTPGEVMRRGLRSLAFRQSARGVSTVE